MQESTQFRFGSLIPNSMTVNISELAMLFYSLEFKSQKLVIMPQRTETLNVHF